MVLDIVIRTFWKDKFLCSMKFENDKPQSGDFIKVNLQEYRVLGMVYEYQKNIEPHLLVVKI